MSSIAAPEAARSPSPACGGTPRCPRPLRATRRTCCSCSSTKALRPRAVQCSHQFFAQVHVVAHLPSPPRRSAPPSSSVARRAPRPRRASRLIVRSSVTAASVGASSSNARGSASIVGTRSSGAHVIHAVSQRDRRVHRARVGRSWSVRQRAHQLRVAAAIRSAADVLQCLGEIGRDLPSLGSDRHDPRRRTPRRREGAEHGRERGHRPPPRRAATAPSGARRRRTARWTTGRGRAAVDPPGASVDGPTESPSPRDLSPGTA